jgi:hypothetical protein
MIYSNTECQAKKNDYKDKSKKESKKVFNNHIRHKRTNGESLTRGLRSLTRVCSGKQLIHF